jgi:hypothetical protein
MSRTLIALAVFAVMALVNFDATTLAQDAQAEATARAARHQAASDSARSALDIATPTEGAAPKRDDSALGPQTEQLKRRAGEQGGPDAQGRTLILGMKVQEVEHGGVKVIDVGAATPAYEGGIRKGDQIVSFQNFKANDYRKWIDGMRRVATEAKDGDMLTVVVMRDGNPVTTKVRVPESHVGPVQLPLGPPPGQQLGTSSPPPAAPGGDEVAIANTNVAIENSAQFANFFGDQSGAATERAVAELHRVASGKVDQNDGNLQTTPAPNPRGARIGLAGFRNDPNGMVVMVDVGGLEPGNYTVGIGDSTAAMNTPPTNPGNPAGSKLPAPTQPQSNSQPAEISRSVLADVAPNADTAAGVTAPATGQVNPLTAPATGQVNPTNTTPTGQSTVDKAQLRERNDQNAKPAGAPGITEIGTLTVDQSGTGRMQHIVEGIRVRNVVGQALIISSAISPAAKTLPPDLDRTVDPAHSKDNSTPSPAAASGNSLPAAAGIIRLISDRSPAPPTGGESVAPGTSLVPAANPSAPARTGPRR